MKTYNQGKRKEEKKKNNGCQQSAQIHRDRNLKKGCAHEFPYMYIKLMQGNKRKKIFSFLNRIQTMSGDYKR
jgi:hypothetical protein